MKKKIIIISLFLVIIFFIIYKLTEGPNIINTTYLKDDKEYKDIKVSDIDSIRINRYNEGGLNSEVVSNKDKIKKLFNTLINMKYGEETDRACEDNSTIYIINLKDGTSKNITIECDWIIIGEKRYMIVKQEEIWKRNVTVDLIVNVVVMKVKSVLAKENVLVDAKNQRKNVDVKNR